jgi:hypothetical protein
VALVGGLALPPLAASDTTGGSFSVSTGFVPSFVPPAEYEGMVTLNFSAGSEAGDAITLPFTIQPPSLSAVPEPGSMVLALTSLTMGAGYAWRRRKRRPGTVTKERARGHAMQWSVIAMVVCMAGATAARAQGLPDVPAGTVVSEVMMDVQGSEALMYGFVLGAVPGGQSLSGTSSTDMAAGSFSFSLLPGSTYLGQSISDSLQGQFDPATSSYNWKGSGSSNGINWQLQGNVVPREVNDVGPVWKLPPVEQWTFLGGLGGGLKSTEEVTVFGTGNPALSTRTTTWTDLSGKVLAESSGWDTYDSTTGTTTELLIPKFSLKLLGESTTSTTPVTGGPGTYISTINSVPEPSTWVMGLLGSLGVIGYTCWTRKAAAGA